jgi:hypothetical protein
MVQARPVPGAPFRVALQLARRGEVLGAPTYAPGNLNPLPSPLERSEWRELERSLRANEPIVNSRQPESVKRKPRVASRIVHQRVRAVK